jgi:hypothetical protein
MQPFPVGGSNLPLEKKSSSCLDGMCSFNSNSITISYNTMKQNKKNKKNYLEQIYFQLMEALKEGMEMRRLRTQPAASCITEGK